jgi:adenylate cyclase
MASRMESHGLPSCIQVTQTVYERLSGLYAFRDRGIIDVKSKGPTPTYLLLARI